MIAIAEDKGVAKRLGLGLRAAGGSVETYPSLDALGKGDIQAALVVVHVAGENAEAIPALDRRLDAKAHIIAVLPASDLAGTVAVMQSSGRLAGVLTEDVLDGQALPEMASRLLHGDIFGAEKVVPWGTRIYSALVGDYQEKSVCIAQLSEFAATMGVRRKYREAIEQCADEMLMNALYDAPVDAEGKQIFADVPTRTRISLRMEQKAVVQYACDGDTFTLSVRDSFGTLERDTVVRYLHKCLHAEQQIDRKTGGAGLGLYIIANATTLFAFNVLPGVATECLVTFDLNAPKIQLKRFGLFSERIDASGRLAAGTSKLLPSGAKHPVERRETPGAAPRAVLYGLVGSIVLLLALIGLVAYPRFAEPPTAPVLITTQPEGATIEIDGRVRGATEDGALEITGLEVGHAYKVLARKEGWNPAEAVIEPVKGDTERVTLSLVPRESVVFLDSEPTGARVFEGDRELGVTPLRLADLPAGEQVELVFRKPGYLDQPRTVRVPAPGGEAQIATSLAMSPDVGSVRITSDPPGAQIFQNDELLAGRTTPIPEHVVESGKSYRFTLKKAGFQPATVELEVPPGERVIPIDVALAPGGSLSIESNVRGYASVSGVKACTRVELPMLECPVPSGTHAVAIRGTYPYARADVKVTVDGDEVSETVRFGFVKAAEGHDLEVRGRKMDRIGLPPGSHQVKVVARETGESETLGLQISAGVTETVP